ncbi:hypothetical protein [Prochlorothrix hollandica]|uniref:hypothetical protein n=1 Tax=Prochlorothrix hollandica TaxID=1223 RepID=UPI00333EF9D8
MSDLMVQRWIVGLVLLGGLIFLLDLDPQGFLPSPLMLVGGLVLAIASNRRALRPTIAKPEPPPPLATPPPRPSPRLPFED